MTRLGPRKAGTGRASYLGARTLAGNADPGAAAIAFEAMARG